MNKMLLITIFILSFIFFSYSLIHNDVFNKYREIQEIKFKFVTNDLRHTHKAMTGKYMANGRICSECGEIIQ